MQDVDRVNRARCNERQMEPIDYWHHRYTTLQVNQCYQILRVAAFVEDPDAITHDRSALSASAVAQYALMAQKI